jgi:hypothetical protein
MASSVPPSITFWVRLEPQSRDPNMTGGLQAQVRDPLWMLARQWQVGEFTGQDAGSPIQASFRIQYAPFTGYRPSAGSGPVPVPLDPGLPLETHVEREQVSLGTRASVQWGLYFEGLLRASAIAGTPQLIADFRTAYPVQPNPAAPAYDEVPDVAGAQFTSAVYGRVTDGQALYADAAASLPGQPAHLPASAQAVFTQLLPILQAFAAYCGSLYSQPNADSAWSPRPPDASGASDLGRLQYDFALGSQSDMMDIGFKAPEFPGGHLDWYSFSATTDTLDTGAPAQATAEYRTILPTHVTFRGMPTQSFWHFEDSMIDFGQMNTNQTDLATMLVAEFAVAYGGDWFSVPVQLPFGSLSQISLVVVTDTFGQRTLVRPTGAQVPAGQAPWTMFTIAGESTTTDMLVLPPTLGAVQNGAPLEAVDFLLDDAAALGWAVERSLQGPLDAAVDGYEWYLQRIKAVPAPPGPQSTAGGPSIYYLLGTTVPDNWIPLVPEQTGPGAPPFLRRGVMLRLDPTQTPPAPVAVPPHGQILQPAYPAASPLFLADQAVPQAGLQIQRYFRRTRWTDGSTHVWIARQVLPGRGPGASGLAFDLIKSMTPP